MLRASLILAAVSAVLALPLGSDASIHRAGAPAGAQHAAADPPGTITVRARTGRGVWRKSLSLKLNKDRLVTFEVCGLWNQPPSVLFTAKCTAPAGTKLPNGTLLRLEQNPIRKALRRADSPGWGLLAMTDHSEIEAVLSNTLTGNVYGTFHYRVTLRNPSGQVLATSNALTLYWHR